MELLVYQERRDQLELLEGPELLVNLEILEHLEK